MADELKINPSGINISAEGSAALAQAKAIRMQAGAAQTKGAVTDGQARKVAGQFESMIVSQMFKEMWNTVPESSLFGHSNEQGIYKDMLNQAIADSLQNGPGLGVREVVYKDIKRMQNVTKAYSDIDQGGKDEGK